MMNSTSKSISLVASLPTHSNQFTSLLNSSLITKRALLLAGSASLGTISSGLKLVMPKTNRFISSSKLPLLLGTPRHPSLSSSKDPCSKSSSNSNNSRTILRIPCLPIQQEGQLKYRLMTNQNIQPHKIQPSLQLQIKVKIPKLQQLINRLECLIPRPLLPGQ